MTEVYHRQLDGGPTIVVKNGFLDEKGTAQDVGLVQRSKSAPNRLHKSGEDRADILTDEDLDRDCASNGSITAPPSPPQGPERQSPHKCPASPPGPSGILMSVINRSPYQAMQQTPDLSAENDLDNFELGEAAVGFRLSGLDDDEDDTKEGAGWMLPQAHQLPGKTAASLPATQTSPQTGSPLTSPALQPQLSPQVLGQLLASQAAALEAVQQMSTQQLWQLGMGATPGMAATPSSSCKPSPTLSPQMSPQMTPQLSAQLAPGMLCSPLQTPLPTPQQSPQLQAQSPPQLRQPQALQKSPPHSPSPSRAQSPQLQSHSPPPQPVPRLTPCPVGLQSARLQPHTIRHSMNAETGMHQVSWTVDAAKLKGHERQTVSPIFELPFEGQVSFRLVLVPKPNPDGKGGASFKKAGGMGSVHLKCEACHGVVSFFVSISNGRPDYQRHPRGPVKHNFAELSTCGLPKGQEQWDFSKAVEKVCLDIASESELGK
eukprot:TRINITY_DN22419_c0_g1_i2.p1 TRINITY_DN22419_c0_g1~~TRINITY_DN22419_c0_g1_i2.p1  ORF type:complete len:487 (-),score=92.21 TRINITY_DN22419_c0_g1_i2:13-1473(-)